MSGDATAAPGELVGGVVKPCGEFLRRPGLHLEYGSGLPVLTESDVGMVSLRDGGQSEALAARSTNMNCNGL
jgi:hypothetical protein